MVSAVRNSNENAIWTNCHGYAQAIDPSVSPICVENAEYPASLELHKVYRLVADKEAERDGDLRVIDESGEDYLYPAKYFVVVSLSAGDWADPIQFLSPQSWPLEALVVFQRTP